MDLNTLTKLLNIADYKVVEIISITEKEMHLRLEPYKKKEAICSGLNSNSSAQEKKDIY